MVIENEYDIIPGELELSMIEHLIFAHKKREYILQDIVQGFKNEYEFILIDCMPSLGLLTINALVASDEVIIPTMADYLAIKGMELLLCTIAKVKRRFNKSLLISGILFSMVEQRTIMARSVIELIHELYGDSIYIFDSIIPKSIKVAEANANNKPITLYCPKHGVANAYRSFVKEFLDEEKTKEL